MSPFYASKTHMIDGELAIPSTLSIIFYGPVSII